MKFFYYVVTCLAKFQVQLAQWPVFSAWNFMRLGKYPLTYFETTFFRDLDLIWPRYWARRFQKIFKSNLNFASFETHVSCMNENFEIFWTAKMMKFEIFTVNFGYKKFFSGKDLLCCSFWCSCGYRIFCSLRVNFSPISRRRLFSLRG